MAEEHAHSRPGKNGKRNYYQWVIGILVGVIIFGAGRFSSTAPHDALRDEIMKTKEYTEQTCSDLKLRATTNATNISNITSRLDRIELKLDELIKMVK